ncbi:MAG: NAD-dependent epimerase/dehydratase family protein [Candidatus Omnitrophica bacterium]|nr:NAD-dependent epimerase/dehydratase family protein [Candidatus Omnitrophota bacterium]
MKSKHLSRNTYSRNPNKNLRQKIFITGGCGFVGANFVKYLLDNGSYDITVYDNVSAGSKKNLDIAIKNSRQKGRCQFIEGDILDKRTLSKKVRKHDAIVHLAAHTQVLESIKSPQQGFDINVAGTLHCLEAARENRIKKFIFASSNAVVGEQSIPINEEMIPEPLSPYGASKVCGEALCSAYYSSYGIKTTSLRFANVYGAYSYHKTSVITKFIKRIMNGQILTIYGTGKQTRDFIHADDISLAISLALRSNQGGEVFQIGTGTETSVNKLITLLTTLLTNKKTKIIRTAAKKGEIVRNCSSIKKAQKILRFTPMIDLENGLSDIVKYFSTIS